MPKSLSLTVTAQGGLLRVIQTKCRISAAFDPNVTPQDQHPIHAEFDAIWDTGATASVITQNVVDACGLKATGMTQVQGVHGSDTVETYLINMLLPNMVGVAHIQVTKGNLGGGAQVLIGMDIITIGDFTITNKDGNTVMSFRTPSSVCIDFVKEHNAELLRQKFSHGGTKKKREKKHKTFGKNKHKK